MDTYNSNIYNLYKIATLENEGWGTAYEYRAKLPFLDKLFEKTDIKKVMILGLPEKYGYSMDFVLYTYFNKIENIIVFDDRQNKIDNFSKMLTEVGVHFGITPNVKVQKVHSWSEIKNEQVDVILSCEVLQRLDDQSKDSYIKYILNNTKKYLIFVPNGKNRAHEGISELKTLYVDILVELFKETKIIEFGYIDCPPHPPGISFKNKKSSIKNKWKGFIIYMLLSIWYNVFEGQKNSFFFKNLFETNAHIVFVAGEREVNRKK